MQANVLSSSANKAQTSSGYSNRYSSRRSPPKSPPKTQGQKDEINANDIKVTEKSRSRTEVEDQEIKLLSNSDNKRDSSSNQNTSRTGRTEEKNPVHHESEEESPQRPESRDALPSSSRQRDGKDNLAKNQETNESFGRPSGNENKNQKEEDEDELLQELKNLANEIPPPQRSTASPNKNRVADRSYVRNSQNVSQLNHTTNVRSISPNTITVEEFQEYYDIFCIAFLKKKEEELERKRRWKEEQELAELQDKPTIFSRPQTRQHIPLLERTPILNARREREIEKIRKEKEAKMLLEERELTFQPKINDRSKELVSPAKDYLKNGRLYSRPYKGSPSPGKKKKGFFKPSINEHSRNLAGKKERISDDVVDRLYYEFDMTQNKKEELARRLAPNFTPILNKKTQKLGRKGGTGETQDYIIHTEAGDAYAEEDYNTDNYAEYDHPGKRCETEPLRGTGRFGSAEEIDEKDLDPTQSSEVELLEILKEFNKMLKQKNENPINLQQLGSLMAGFAEKRKLEREAEKRKLEKEEKLQQQKQNEAQSQEYSEGENAGEPIKQRFDTEVSHKTPEKAAERETRSRGSIPSDHKAQSEKGENKDNKKVSPIKQSKKDITETPHKEEKRPVERVQVHEISSGSKPSSPEKSGDMMSHLIHHPRSKNKNDEYPQTPINPELVQKALGDGYQSPQRTGGKRTLYSNAKPSGKKSQSPDMKGARDSSPYSPKTPTKKQEKTITFKEVITPKKTASGKKEKNSSRKKSKSPISKKDSLKKEKGFSSKGEKGDGTKVKGKSGKKVKGSKTKGKGKAKEEEESSEPEKICLEKFTQTSKKSRLGSDYSSQIVDSKNGLEGWSHRELKEPGEEDLFVDRDQEEEERPHNRYNAAPNEQSFGSQNRDSQNEMEKNKSYNSLKGDKNKTGSHANDSRYGKNSSKSSLRNAGQRGNNEDGNEQDEQRSHQNKANRTSSKPSLKNASKANEEGSSMRAEQETPNQIKGRSRAQTDDVVSPRRTTSRFAPTRKRGYSDTKEKDFKSKVGSLKNIPGDSRNSSKNRGPSSSHKEPKDQTKQSISSIKHYQSGLQDDAEQFTDENYLLEDQHHVEDDSIDHDSNSHDNSSRESEQDENVKGDGNVSFSANHNERSNYTEHQAPQNEQRTQDENINNSKTRKKSRKPPRPENQVISTETIQIYPNSKNGYGYSFSMDRRDTGIQSASSKELKAIAEHIVKKFKAYDAQIKKTGREYTVSVSPPRSGSHSPDQRESINEQKAQKLRESQQKKVFKSVQQDTQPNKKESATAKKPRSVQENLNSTLLSNSSAKKVEANKRYSVVSGPVARYTGGK